VPDGRTTTLTLNRQRRRLSETYIDGGGAKRMRIPNINFVLDAEGQVAFNFGGVKAVAASILRRFVS
jgi:hypothetical protein